jgi:hypothetical protein
MPATEKTKEERFKEGIYLLQQVKDLIKNDLSPGYAELKERISEWVTTGKSWSGRIDFMIIGRYAEVELPRTNARAASANFKAKRVL